MDLELSDDQLDLRDNVRAVLEGICPTTLVREQFERAGDNSELWASQVDLDWPALGVPEGCGGVGLGFVEVGLLAEELGRVAAPGPLLATVSQFIPLLVELGVQPELGELLASGRSGCLAFAERNRWEAVAVETMAVRSAGEWLLSGSKGAVLSGAESDTVAVVAREEGTEALGVFLVEAQACGRKVEGDLDPGLGLARLTFDRTPGALIGEPGDSTAKALDRTVEQAGVAMALHTIGACRRIFEVTLEYAKTREQFGRAIGSFQALKHRLAEMYLAVERAHAVTYYAAAAIAEDDPRRVEAAHLAKAAAGDCQRLLAEDGLQLHGGIGFTWEHNLHFLLKRAKAGELLCGSAAYHRSRLAALLGLPSNATA